MLLIEQGICMDFSGDINRILRPALAPARVGAVQAGTGLGRA